MKKKLCLLAVLGVLSLGVTSCTPNVSQTSLPSVTNGKDGQDGEDGRGIVKIEKTSTSGNVDTYTITYTDNTTSTFTVTNGKDGQDGQKGEQGIQGIPGDDGHTPTVSINDDGYWVIDGKVTTIKAEGTDGAKGDKGDKGDTGEKGDQGEDGLTAWSNTILPSENGYVSVNLGSATVGEEVTFTMYPDHNYYLASLTLNGQEVSEGITRNSENGTYTYTTNMVEHGFVVKANFDNASSQYYEDGKLYSSIVDPFGNVISDKVLVEGAHQFVGGSGSLEDPIVIDSSDDLNSINHESIEAVKLNNDIAIDTNAGLTFNTKNPNTTIDLNGKTLSIGNSSSNTATSGINENQVVNISNGNISYNGLAGTNTAFAVNKGGSLTLDKVNLDSNGTPVAVFDDATQVKITNSTIVGGYYGFSTNASNWDNIKSVKIDIENSTIKATHSSKDNTGVLINIAADVNITNTNIQADRQALIVRSGNVNLTNSNLYYTEEYTGTSFHYNDKWTSGNEVAYAAIVVGDNQNTAYGFDASLNMDGVEIIKGEIDKTEDTPVTTSSSVIPYFLYVNGDTTNSTKATINIDKDSWNKLFEQRYRIYLGDYESHINVDETAYDENDPRLNGEKISIPDANKLTGLDKNYSKIYTVTGIWTGTTNDYYGNGNIADKTTGETLLVYGLTNAANYTSLVAGQTEGEYKFDNPRNFGTTLDDKLNAGDMVTLTGIIVDYNGTSEFMGYVDTIVDSQSYDVVVQYGEMSNGSVTSNLTDNKTKYGDDIEFTITPDDGYKLSSLLINGTNVTSQVVENKLTYKNNNFCTVITIEATFVESSVDTTPTEFNYNLLDLTWNPNMGTGYAQRTAITEHGNIYFSCSAEATSSWNSGVVLGANGGDKYTTSTIVHAAVLKGAGVDTDVDANHIDNKYYLSLEMQFDVKAKEFGIIINTDNGEGSKVTPKILKSTDGGTTWSIVDSTATTDSTAKTKTILASNENGEKARYAVLIETTTAKTRVNIKSIFANAAISDAE